MEENKTKHIENIELRSEEVQEILSSPPNWMIRWGSVLFLILIIVLLAIAWFVKYPDIITSEAIITTQIPPQKVYANSTGILDTVFVNDNQIVKPFQSLAIIENTSNYKDVLLLKSVMDTIKINNKSFRFPIDQLPVLFLGDIDANFALFENNYIQYSLNKQLDPFSNEANANRFSLIELNNRLSNLLAQKKINKSELEFKRKDLERYNTPTKSDHCLS